MADAHQLAYLKALGIPVWVRRGDSGQADQMSDQWAVSTLKLGPGSSSILLVCSNTNEPAGQLASDIARAFSGEPVWAWPAGGEDVHSVESAVNEQLFTTVVVFGQALAWQVFGKQVPEMIGPARILVVPGMNDLTTCPAERRRLWQTMCSRRLVASR